MAFIFFSRGWGGSRWKEKSLRVLCWGSSQWAEIIHMSVWCEAALACEGKLPNLKRCWWKHQRSLDGCNTFWWIVKLHHSDEDDVSRNTIVYDTCVMIKPTSLRSKMQNAFWTPDSDGARWRHEILKGHPTAMTEDGLKFEMVGGLSFYYSPVAQNLTF